MTADRISIHTRREQAGRASSTRHWRSPAMIGPRPLASDGHQILTF
jgi:hypothetical protein